MEAPTNMPRIGIQDQEKAKEAVRTALNTLLNGGVENVATVSGRWKAEATRGKNTGYNIHLWAT